MNKFLKVTSVGPITEASNKREYAVLGFKPVTYMGDKIVLNNQKPINRVVWGQFTDEKGNNYNADSIFTSVKTKELEVGALVEGSIVRANTTEWTLNDRKVTSFTTVVFSSEDATTYINKQLKPHKAVVIDEDGELTADLSQFVNQPVAQD